MHGISDAYKDVSIFQACTATSVNLLLFGSVSDFLLHYKSHGPISKHFNLNVFQMQKLGGSFY